MRDADGGRQKVPLAVWYPVDSEKDCVTSEAAVYSHRISVAKIARVLLNLGAAPPTWIDKDMSLRADSRIISGKEVDRPVPKERAKAVVLCHGYLGSRFDLLDFAEELSKAGFVVAAPEFAESLSEPKIMPNYERPGAKGQPKGAGASRPEILAGTLKFLSDRFGVSQSGVALLGHSAGAGTVSKAEGKFAARIPIAGFFGENPDIKNDPLLVIASEGDNVISLYPKDSGAFGPQKGIASEVKSLGLDVEEFDGNSSSSLSKLSDSSPPPAKAFIKYTGAGSPCHISFLSSRTNDGMVTALAPLLPLARLLKIPLLDFDVYESTRDSDKVLKELVPAVSAWLVSVTK